MPFRNYWGSISPFWYCEECYQQDSRVSYTSITNKSFGQLLDISHKSFFFLKTFASEFSYIDVWFTDQNSNPTGVEDKINMTFFLLQLKCKI